MLLDSSAAAAAATADRTVYLRGLRCCSGHSDTFNEEDFERDTEEENRNKKCSIEGAFLDRDGNAAANIV